MVKHHGQILEYTVRKAGYSISELANELKVNRRTLYNWFRAPKIRIDIIYRIGIIIRHDFSLDFPEVLTFSEPIVQSKPTIHDAILNDSVWKDKYISLLENYNTLLNKATTNEQGNIVFPS